MGSGMILDATLSPGPVIAQRVDQHGTGGGWLPAARIVEMVTRERRALRADRQLSSRLSEIPCRPATNQTLPPSASISASKAAFSAALHVRRRSMDARMSASVK